MVMLAVIERELELKYLSKFDWLFFLVLQHTRRSLALCKVPHDTAMRVIVGNSLLVDVFLLLFSSFKQCAFREILGYLICLDTETMTALQRTIAPVLRRLLICVGGYLSPAQVPINNIAANLNLPTTATSMAVTAAISSAAMMGENTVGQVDASPPDQHRRANLALATLVELAKGQDGEMSIGRDTSNGTIVFGRNHFSL